MRKSFGLPCLVGIALFGLAACQPAVAPLALQEPQPVNGIGYLVLNAPIVPASRDLFIRDVDKLRAAGAHEIHFGINSPGGDIDAAQAIVDYMAQQHAQNGLVFKAYNLGLVASAATYVFLNAQDRYSSAKGAFLFHAAGVTTTGAVNAQNLREAADKLDSYERIVRATMKAHTHLNDAETLTYVRRTVILNSDDARRDGVIDAIADFSVPKEARGYVIAVKPTTPAARPPAPAPN
jgi:ATP-dependent protease ClpP protease subunit